MLCAYCLVERMGVGREERREREREKERKKGRKEEILPTQMKTIKDGFMFARED